MTSLATPVPAVRLTDVHLSLASAAGTVSILRGIDLELAAGERIGLVGPSGSGKTSLLMVIAGLERVSRGCIDVAGRDITALDEDALARFRRDHVGIVFQNFHLVPTMTAIENVALPLELAGAADALVHAGEGLAAVGLAARTRHYPSQLSGGEQQRVALARAFVGEPRVLLADEPTGNLDAATGAAVMQLLFDLQRRSRSTLLLITHDPALAEACDRIVEIRDGRISGNRRRATTPASSAA
ncbi:ABC transporter ATP-binding protein [Defluviicoccus vanus]|uniref:ABC transporter ATP-binding protein n=1 Tax=Defluviicoccus vanus TaxID=111831 RepID=A0A7H1MYU5_9PROT|nr:ABC transporter ATP-binding protein [Defluviicoccus vanus]QNT68631.1 ABC transporter ATP-binding protein [Defluviicoccus vanus]